MARIEPVVAPTVPVIVTDGPRQAGVEIVLGDLVVFVGNDVPTARLVEIVLAMRSA